MNEAQNSALAPAAEPCPIVIVKVSGGRVQGTVTNVPGLDVLVLDYDTEGAGADELAMFPEADGDEDEAISYYESPLVAADYAEKLVSIKEVFDDRQEDAREAADVQG